MTYKTPPDTVRSAQQITLPILHKINCFYKDFYLIKNKLAKGDKLGIGLEIEKIILAIYELAISAALSSKIEKIPLLQSLRIKTEVIKKLVRLMEEIKIIKTASYWNLQKHLEEISRDATNWQASLISKELK